MTPGVVGNAAEGVRIEAASVVGRGGHSNGSDVRAAHLVASHRSAVAALLISADQRGFWDCGKRHRNAEQRMDSWRLQCTEHKVYDRDGCLLDDD